MSPRCVLLSRKILTVLVPRQRFPCQATFTSMLPRTRCAVPMTMTPRMALKLFFRQETDLPLWQRCVSIRSAGTNGVVAATFSLRLKGKPVLTTEPLKVKVDLNSTLQVSAGAKLEMVVEAAGGVPPYSYVWKKGSSPVSGQTAATFSKASAASGDAGAYTCEISDSASPVNKVTSTSCTVTVS